MISNAYAGLFSKLPVLKCHMNDQYVTFDLKKFTVFYVPNLEDIQKGKKVSGDSDQMILEVTDELYYFLTKMRNNDGSYYTNTFNVNRYSGVIDGWISETVLGENDPETFRKLKSQKHYWNGTCKGTK
jgi:hypothetical protein